jgi:hypothetical protein
MERKFDVIKATGPGFMTKTVFKYLCSNDKNDITILPMHSFYPISNKLRDKVSMENY